MTTIESAKRMVWLTDEEQHPPRERQAHLGERLRRSSTPSRAAASTVFAGTPRMPSAVIRIAGGIA